MDKEFFLSAAGIPPPLHSQTASFSSWRPVSSTPMETQPHPHHNSWEKSTGQFPHFDSSLSSVAPSPAAKTAIGVAGGDGSVIRELIGRMGSICSSGEVAPSQPLFVTASSTMALNPAPKLMNMPAMMNHFEEERLPSLGNPIPGNHAIEFPGDPGFAERAAKFSSFGSGSFNGRTAQMGVNKSESLLRSNPLTHRASSTPSLEMSGSQIGIHETKKFSRLSNGSSPRSHAELGNSQEESSVSEQIPTGEKENLGLKGSSNDLNSRKRKAVSCRGSKGKELLSSTPSTKAHKIVEDEHSNAAKRCKLAEGNGSGNENGNVKAEEDPKISSPKLSEPPKDYIHVRARRGQATDSHSLAERVRREKISERMKLLQDLVPGCNKVTGKALMLDEIINYVQSLQRQVEFLSMKLASADFKPDFNNSDNALQKDNMFQTSTSMPHPIYDHPLDSSAAAFYGQQSQRGNPLKGNNIPCGSVDPILEKALIGNHSMELPQLNGFVDESLPQLPAIAHDDLQSIVQMGFGHNPHQEPAFLSQNFHGTEKKKTNSSFWTHEMMR